MPHMPCILSSSSSASSPFLPLFLSPAMLRRADARHAADLCRRRRFYRFSSPPLCESSACAKMFDFRRQRQKRASGRRGAGRHRAPDFPPPFFAITPPRLPAALCAPRCVFRRFVIQAQRFAALLMSRRRLPTPGLPPVALMPPTRLSPEPPRRSAKQRFHASLLSARRQQQQQPQRKCKRGYTRVRVGAPPELTAHSRDSVAAQNTAR